MYNYDLNGLENNREEILANVYQDHDLPYWKDRNHQQEEYNFNENDYCKMKESLRNSSSRFKTFTSQKGFHDKNNDFMNYNHVQYSTVKTSDLIKELENKNSEILKLNLKIQELERTRNEMLIDLESYETEFQIAEKRLIARENELNDKLQISELEKKNLNNKLDYFQQIDPSLNFNYHSLGDHTLTASKKQAEEIITLNDKLDLFYEFYIQLESNLINKNSQKLVLQNLDCFALKFRFNQIIESLKNLINIKNEAQKAEMNYDKLTNENRSQKSSHKEISKKDSKFIQSNFDKTPKKEAILDSERLVKKISTFTPPTLDVNVSIDSLKNNNNMITDTNNINNKSNERIQMEKKTNMNIQEEKLEKLVQTMSKVAEQITQLQENYNKKAQENEKSIQKTEGSKFEGRSKISGNSQNNNSRGSFQRKNSKMN